MSALLPAAAALGASPALDQPRNLQPSKPVLARLITRISTAQGVDPRLVHALVRVESGYNPRAVSRRGAMGLMQIMPSTARRLNVRHPFDPTENVRAGVRELSRLIERYAGDLPRALAAYNAGETAVNRYGGVPPYRETRRYVAKIMSLYTGRPYRIDLGVHRLPVRLVRNGVAGEPVITNLASSEDPPPLHLGGGPIASALHRSTLSGGFGR